MIFHSEYEQSMIQLYEKRFMYKCGVLIFYSVCNGRITIV